MGSAVYHFIMFVLNLLVVILDPKNEDDEPGDG
jgi:hypothetical protein